MINEKAVKAGNFLRSIYPLTMLDTLLLRLSLHFTQLHFTPIHYSSCPWPLLTKVNDTLKRVLAFSFWIFTLYFNIVTTSRQIIVNWTKELSLDTVILLNPRGKKTIKFPLSSAGILAFVCIRELPEYFAVLIWIGTETIDDIHNVWYHVTELQTFK